MDMFFIFFIPAFAALSDVVRDFGSTCASNAEKKSAALAIKLQLATMRPSSEIPPLHDAALLRPHDLSRSLLLFQELLAPYLYGLEA